MAHPLSQVAYIVRDNRSGEQEYVDEFSDIARTISAFGTVNLSVFELQYDVSKGLIVSEDVTREAVRKLAKDGLLDPDDLITHRYGDWLTDRYFGDGEPVECAPFFV